MRDEISDELRKWAAAHTPVKLGYQLACGPVEEVIAIADRIDATNKADRQAAYDKGFNIGFASADDWYADKGDDDLAEHGLVRMPRDDDNKPIRVGDVVDFEGGTGEVVGYVRNGGGIWTVRCGSGREPGSCRLHTPTPAEHIRTVAKNINEDYCNEYGHDPDSYVWDQVVYLFAIADELEGGAK